MKENNSREIEMKMKKNRLDEAFVSEKGNKVCVVMEICWQENNDEA